MILRPAECLHAFAIRAAGLVDVFANGSGTDKTDRIDVLMGEQSIDRHFVAVQDVPNPIGQAGLRPELGNPIRYRGVALGWLVDIGIATRNRHHPHPQRNHERKVKRGDAANDTYWLAKRIEINSPTDVGIELALDKVRDAAGKFGNIDATLDLAFGIRDGLAVLLPEQIG